MLVPVLWRKPFGTSARREATIACNALAEVTKHLASNFDVHLPQYHLDWKLCLIECHFIKDHDQAMAFKRDTGTTFSHPRANFPSIFWMYSYKCIQDPPWARTTAIMKLFGTGHPRLLIKGKTCTHIYVSVHVVRDVGLLGLHSIEEFNYLVIRLKKSG